MKKAVVNLGVVLCAVAGMVALSGVSLAQGTEETPDTASVTPAVEAVGLVLGTYEPGWIRYRNDGPDGALILQVEGVTRFPWMAINNGDSAITSEDFDDPEFIGDLIQTREIVYDEDLVAGECDAVILLRYRSTDLFCTPGTRVLELGNIFLTLFHPETRDVVALTTTIDNTIGGARVMRQPSAPAPVTPTARSCGPFFPGQWITHEEYVNSGVTLPVNTDGVWGEITDYQCMLPQAGQPWLQAYTIMDVGGNGGGSGGGDTEEDEAQ